MIWKNATDSVYLHQTKKQSIMLNTTIISQDLNAITVKMSLRKWNHLRKLEESYKIATSIRKGMKQAEKAPVMSVDEAIESLRAL